MSKTLPRLQQKYIDTIHPELMKEMGKDVNTMAVPNITKIVVNSGLGIAKKDSSILDEMMEEMAMITGQKPVITKAKDAISNFKTRKGLEIGMKVTLRRDMMWYFLDRLVSTALPRIKDFRGISPKSFDKNGNYALGLKEHSVFAEIDPNKVTKNKGLQIIICTSTNDDALAFSLLKKLGLPFKEN